MESISKMKQDIFHGWNENCFIAKFTLYIEWIFYFFYQYSLSLYMLAPLFLVRMLIQIDRVFDDVIQKVICQFAFIEKLFLPYTKANSIFILCW